MKILRFLPLLVCFLIIITVGGTYATWKYANLGPSPQKVEITVNMDEFDESLLTLTFTKVELVSDGTGNSPPTEIVWPTTIKSKIGGSKGQKVVYKVTAVNRAESGKYYYISADPSNSNVDVAVSWNSDGIGYFPIKAAPGEEIEFYVIYTLKSNISQSELTVDFNFEVYAYTVTYVNDGVILKLDRITEENSNKAYTLANSSIVTNPPSGNNKFQYWINAGSTKVDNIPANNTEDYVLYPSYENLYTASFVDQDGNVLAWGYYTSTDKGADIKTLGNKTTPPGVEDCVFDYWQVRIPGKTPVKLSEYGFSDGIDITIHPIYTYKGDVSLIPVDTNGDGITDIYHVGGYSNESGQALVEIPGRVNGIYITEITGDSFSSYDGVHSIIIPKDIIYIGDNAFAEEWGTIDSGETITLYYGGSYAEWIAKEASFGSNWESGISSSTRIFFLNGGDTVDVSQGYLQAEVKSSWGKKTVTWNHNATISSSIINEYTGHCDCEISTSGDNAHIYVDSSGNIMKHNADGTPINNNGVIIEYKRKNIFSSYKLTTDNNDTYYRFRPDMEYWQGVTPNG